MRIHRGDVDALQRGVALLGSGGGGDTVPGAILLRTRLTGDRSISVVPVDGLSPGTWTVPVGVVGATAVLAEKPLGRDEFRAAISAVAHWTDHSPGCVMSIEIGGLNGVLPLVAADDLDLPYADADLAGRGLPRLDQLSISAAGRDLTPAALATPNGQVLLLSGGTATDVERTVRACLSTAGGWAVLALAPVPAERLGTCSVVGTVSTAMDLGRRALSVSDSPDVTELETLTGGRVLGTGRVVDVSRGLTAGDRVRPPFGHGSATIRDGAEGALLRLEMENEYLLALRDGTPVASTPDILAVLDRRTGSPVSCDAIRHGLEVVALQLPSAEFWTVEGRIGAVAPRAYGIDCDPVLLAAT